MEAVSESHTRSLLPTHLYTFYNDLWDTLRALKSIATPFEHADTLQSGT